MSRGGVGACKFSMRRNSQSGFTLLEAMVALAIAALVLAALVEGVETGMRSVAIASRNIEALSHARSHLAAIGVGQPLVPGVREGDDGGGFHWRERVARRVGGDAAASLFDVVVDIEWDAWGRPGHVQLATRRLAGRDGRVR